MLPTTPTTSILSICHYGQGEKQLSKSEHVFFCIITESSCVIQNTQSKHAFKRVFNERPTTHVRRVIQNVAELDNLRMISRSKRTEQTWL